MTSHDSPGALRDSVSKRLPADNKKPPVKEAWLVAGCESLYQSNLGKTGRFFQSLYIAKQDSMSNGRPVSLSAMDK